MEPTEVGGRTSHEETRRFRTLNASARANRQLEIGNRQSYGVHRPQQSRQKPLPHVPAGEPGQCELLTHGVADPQATLSIGAETLVLP